METVFRKWLESETPPVTFYELLGLPTLHPDRRVLLQAVRPAFAFFLGSQNHPQPNVSQRALELQNMVAEVERLLADESLWQAYERRFIGRLGEQYVALRGPDRSLWKPHELRQWLQAVHGVHHARLNEVVDGLMIPGANSVDEVPETEVGLVDPELLPARALRFSEAISPQIARSQPESRDVGEPVSNAPAPSRQRAKRPPPPLHKGHTRPRPPIPTTHTASAPPPAQQSDTVPARRRVPAPNAGLFWVFGSAVLTAILLGLIGVLFVMPAVFPPNRDTASTTSEIRPDAARNAGSSSSGGVAGEGTSNTSDQSDEQVEGPGDQTGSRSGKSSNSGTSQAPANGGDGGSDANNDVNSKDAANSGSAEDTARASGPGEDNEPAQSDEAQDRSDGSSPNSGPAGSHEGAMLARFQDGAILAVAWSPDGKQLASAGEDGAVYIWKVESGERLAKLQGHKGIIYDLAWRDGLTDQALASASEDGTVRLWNVRDSKTETKLDEPGTEKRALCWIGRTHRLAVGDKDGVVSVWNTKDWDSKSAKPYAHFDLGRHAGPVRSLRWANPHEELAASREDDLVAAGHLDGSVLIWNIVNRDSGSMLVPETGKILKQLETDEADRNEFSDWLVAPHFHVSCLGVAPAPTERRIAVTGEDLDVWELGDTMLVRVFVFPRTESNSYRTTTWSTDGKRLAVGDSDGAVNVLDVGGWDVVFHHEYGRSINCMEFSPEEGKQHLAVGYDDGTLAVFDLEQSGTSAPDAPFSGAELLDMASEFLADDNWAELVVAMRLLEMHQLSATERSTRDMLEYEIKQKVEMRLKDPPDADKAGKLQLLLDLKGMIDKDPPDAGKAGKLQLLLDLQEMITGKAGKLQLLLDLQEIIDVDPDSGFANVVRQRLESEGMRVRDIYP